MRLSDSKLTPGERAKNWADALIKVWPVLVALLGILGYTNRDHIAQWTGLAEPDHRTEIDGTTDRWVQVQKFSQEVTAELDSIKQNSAAIRRQLQENDRKTLEHLQAQIDELKRWHD